MCVRPSVLCFSAACTWPLVFALGSDHVDPLTSGATRRVSQSDTSTMDVPRDAPAVATRQLARKSRSLIFSRSREPRPHCCVRSCAAGYSNPTTIAPLTRGTRSYSGPPPRFATRSSRPSRPSSTSSTSARPSPRPGGPQVLGLERGTDYRLNESGLRSRSRTARWSRSSALTAAPGGG
jgi:hypothetical protein